MECMMDVVVPLSGRMDRPVSRITAQIARLIAIVLEHQVHMAALAECGSHPRGELRKNVRRRFVDEPVDRVEAQAVKAIFFQPVQRVVNEEFAHAAAVGSIEVDCGAPWRVMAWVEELRRVRVQIIAFGTEVVVNDIENYRQV